MKSLIKKTFAAVVILAAIVDWPVKVEAGCGRVVAKEAVPLLRRCAGKVTVDTEKIVNRSTQMMERYNGYVYTCARCNGSGLIRVVR